MKKLTSTNYENEVFLEYDCPFMLTLHFIGKRWKPAVLWKIEKGFNRFNQLKKEIPNISDKMLSQALNELEQDKILNKTIYQEVPLRVEYSITDFGKSLFPILKQMNTWGNKHLQ